VTDPTGERPPGLNRLHQRVPAVAGRGRGLLPAYSGVRRGAVPSCRAPLEPARCRRRSSPPPRQHEHPVGLSGNHDLSLTCGLPSDPWNRSPIHRDRRILHRPVAPFASETAAAIHLSMRNNRPTYREATIERSRLIIPVPLHTGEAEMLATQSGRIVSLGRVRSSRCLKPGRRRSDCRRPLQVTLLGTGSPTLSAEPMGPCTRWRPEARSSCSDADVGAPFDWPRHAFRGELTSVFLTHLHADHTLPLSICSHRLISVERNPLDVRGPSGTRR